LKFKKTEKEVDLSELKRYRIDEAKLESVLK